MDTATRDKVDAMLSGYAVPLQIGELEQIESERNDVRTAHNADAIGTRSAPYVGWISDDGKRVPPGLKYDRVTMRAQASAGRLIHA